MARTKRNLLEEFAIDYENTKAADDRGQKVRKANQLIQKNRFDMSVTEQRLLLYCISKIKPKDKADKLYRVKIRDIYRACGIDNANKKAYEAMKEAVKRLDSFNFYQKDGELVHWIRDTKVDPKDDHGYISFRFDPRITQYLFNVRKYFTEYQLGNALRMRSVYSIRLYELMKSYGNLKGKSFTLDELAYLLGADIRTEKMRIKREDGQETIVYITKDNKSYKQYRNLKQKVIDPAIKEINEGTDILLSYEEIKTGRKVTGIRFDIEDISGDRMVQEYNYIKSRRNNPESF